MTKCDIYELEKAGARELAEIYGKYATICSEFMKDMNKGDTGYEDLEALREVLRSTQREFMVNQVIL